MYLHVRPQGYAVGPPVWGPLSERLGRKWPMTVGICLFTVFCVPAAVGRNMETLLISRFFQGAFGWAPLSLAGGGVVDIWSPAHRGGAIAACVGTIFGSPILAPIMGNFITASPLDWRWTQWWLSCCIMGGASVVLVLFGLPETLGPKILQDRAAQLRKSGEKPNARTAFDSKKQARIMDIARIYLMRPFVLLATESILILITIYQSVIYGMLYLVFVAYPVEFRAPIANSAVGGNTLLRSFFGAAFPLFAPFMYHNLGVDWATSTLGFTSIAMMPIPILFYKFGHRVRSWSKNSVSIT
jgi:MFS transporter, DHA1 family, multidrug resistance protein